MGDAGGQPADVRHFLDMRHLLVKGSLFPVGPLDSFDDEPADAAGDEQKKGGGDEDDENDAIAVLVVSFQAIGDLGLDHQKPHVAVQPFAGIEEFVVGG